MISPGTMSTIFSSNRGVRKCEIMAHLQCLYFILLTHSLCQLFYTDHEEGIQMLFKGIKQSIVRYQTNLLADEKYWKGAEFSLRRVGSFYYNNISTSWDLGGRTWVSFAEVQR